MYATTKNRLCEDPIYQKEEENIDFILKQNIYKSFPYSFLLFYWLKIQLNYKFTLNKLKLWLQIF
jgi:hypothetical protein